MTTSCCSFLTLPTHFSVTFLLLCDATLTLYIKWTYTFFQCHIVPWSPAVDMCCSDQWLFFFLSFSLCFSLNQRVTFHWMSPGITSDLWSRKADLTPRRNALCHHNNQFQIGVPLTIGCYGNSPVIKLFSYPFFQKSLSCVMFSRIFVTKLLYLTKSCSKGVFDVDNLFQPLLLWKPT